MPTNVGYVDGVITLRGTPSKDAINIRRSQTPASKFVKKVIPTNIDSMKDLSNTFVIVSIITSVIIYIILCFPFYLIAKKTNASKSFFAFIPILQCYLYCKIAQISGWWALLFLVPIVNLVFCILYQ